MSEENMSMDDFSQAVDASFNTFKDEDQMAWEKAAFVKAPLLAEAPVSIECRVTEVKHLGSHDLFLAKVLAVHAEEAYMDNRRRFDLKSARPLTYSHGEYFGLGKKLGDFGFSVKKKK